MDSLSELQNYQEIVRIAAIAEWQREHPGETAPSDLRDSIRFTIDHIDEGSADVFLVLEQHDAYVQQQTVAQDAADAVIAAAFSEADIPTLSSLSPEQDDEFRKAVAQLGSTLVPEQSLEIYPDEPSAPPVSITIETRLSAIDRLARIEDFLLPPSTDVKKSSLETVTSSLVGRVTALDADEKTFKMVLADGHEIHGWYRTDTDLLEDFRDVVNSSAKGPLTRVTGDLQYKNGDIFRFWDTQGVERIQFDETTWGARLAEFAALTPGWDNGTALQISSVALEGAQMLMRAVDGAGIDRPGVFPTDEGGVLIEWADVSGIRSIEVLADGSFETFETLADQHGGLHSATRDLTIAVAFLKVDTA